jgi:hypothetical protein
MKFLAIFLAIIFFITSLALLIVPIIFCYKKFNKGGKGSYIRGFRNFIILYLFVCFFNVGAEMIINSYSTLKTILWILYICLGIAIALLNIIVIKKNAKISHDDYSFNNSSGITGCYSFLYFSIYGAIILYAGVNRNFRPIIDNFGSEYVGDYIKNAWIYYCTYLVYFSGFFFCTSTQYFIFKYDLNKIILIFLTIIQIVLLPLNSMIINELNSKHIIIILSFSLFEIVLGCYFWKKYYSDLDLPKPEDQTDKKAELNNISENIEQI